MEEVSKDAFIDMANNAAQNNPPQITTEMVDEMQNYRSWQVNHECPMRGRSNFQSDEEYKEYLLNTYVKLRENEYKYAVRNETMKVYSLACDAEKNMSLRTSHLDNLLVWEGYKRYINAAKTEEEKERRRQQVADCAIARVPEMGGICINGRPNSVLPSEGLHCCAVTASAVVAQISDEMGYGGDQNLIIPKYRGVSPGRANNFVAAAYISTLDSINDQIRIIPDIAYPPKKKTLNDAVKDGDLKIGDSFALAPRDPNAETTGHAMVLVDVIKDDNGKVTHYTIQGNNPHQLMTIDANKKGGRGTSIVTTGVGTNAFMQGKFAMEREDLSNLSIAELERRVGEQRKKTERVIADLGITERYCVENNFFTQDFSKIYCDQYKKIKQDATYKVVCMIHEVIDIDAEEVGHEDLKIEAAPDTYGRRSPETSKSEDENRAALRSSFKKLDQQKWSQLVDDYFKGEQDTTNLSQELKAQAESAKQRFDTTLQSLLADNGNQISCKESMHQATQLLGEYLRLDGNGTKSLEGFIKYVENASHTHPQTQQKSPPLSILLKKGKDR